MHTPAHGSGSLFVVVAPSGAGKTSLVRALMQERPGIELSVSHTTRPTRPGEVDGRDYFFVDVPEFERLRADGEFLEWAQVHGNLYATSRRFIEARIGTGADLLLEIDWQGARNVRALFPDAVSIFIAPPSIEELRRRLQSRGQDAPEVIERRIANARGELAHLAEFDYVIINQEFTSASAALVSVVDAARLRLRPQVRRHPELLRALGLDPDTLLPR